MTDHSLVVGISLINKTSDGSCELTHGILPFYDAESDQFVGNLSTRATKDQPAAAPINISNLFYTIVDKKDWDDDCEYPVGVPFLGNKFPTLAPLLDGRKQYLIVAANIGFITGWGTDFVVTGKLSDEVTQFLSSIHPLATQWKTLVSEHKKEVGEAILANLTELAPALPALTAKGSVESHPFYSWSPLSAADQNTYEEACTRNTNNLTPFLAPPTPLGGTIAIGGASSGVGGGEEELSAMGTPKQAPTEATDGEKRLAAYRVFGARHLATSGGDRVFTPPFLL